MAAQTPANPLTPDMQAVYAKWEGRGPKVGGGSLGKGSPAIKWDQVGQLAEKITQEGRAKWRERYGESVGPLAHRRARQRNRKPAALPVESVSFTFVLNVCFNYSSFHWTQENF